MEFEKLNAQKLAKEKAVASEKQKDEFLSSMSHEIRTPLNAILGFITPLRKRVDNKEALEYINTIDNSSRTLLNIISDILDFSKIKNNKLSVDKHSFNVYKELNSTLKLFEPIAEQKGAKFEIVFDNISDQHLIGDILRINQIVFNLLSNAFKFSVDDVKITFIAKYIDNYLYIEVKDNGVGIEKSKQDTVFNAFEQADRSTTRKFGGTGLGLSISSKLAKIMGGDLSVISEVGVGSSFILKLPLEVSDKSSHNILEEDEVECHFDGEVLVVEDNKTNQVLIDVLLDDCSIECDIANDGIEAIEAFNKKSYDLILMDENMPRMNGLVAFSKIRDIEKEKGLDKTPIVALTADVGVDGKNNF